MSITAHDQLVAGYLDRLRAATADLPPNEHDELLANVAEHIAMSIAELDEPTEAAIRTILDRLGDPAVIAAEARGQSSRFMPANAPVGWAARPAPAATAARPGALEWTGVAMLGIGSYLLPVVGTIAGLVMISLSRWWTTRQKVVATVLSLAGVVIVPLVAVSLLVPVTHGGPTLPAPIENFEPAQPAANPTPSST